MNLRVLFCLFGLVLAGCADGAKKATDTPIERDYIGPDQTTGGAVDDSESARKHCEELMHRVLEKPAVPGAPGFEAMRPELLARAKAEPVIFIDTPRYGANASNASVAAYRKVLPKTTNAWSTVERLLEEFKGRPQETRAALLRDGYLYAEDPELAYALVSLVQPEDLFGHDRIWIQRGASTLNAERRDGRYFFTDGALKGQRVKLLHLDRVGADAPPGPPLHRDIRTLMYERGFNRMEVRHLTEDYAVANLRYGKWWVPTVLRAEGAELKFECEVLAPNLRSAVDEERHQALRRQKVVQGVRKVVFDEIDEGLPFDEPYHEYGNQLDGKLRNNWLWAYIEHKPTFNYNGDMYLVFDAKGRPHVPQVCVDFLTDTFERLGGTWYTAKSERPERRVGRLDFDKVDTMDRTELRQAPRFVQFAKQKTDWFDVYDVPSDQHARLGDKRFYSFLAKSADELLPGDVLLIKGKTPWDRIHAHYHSFFIFERDPISGVPTILAGNAGHPSLRSWETEVRRTPKRAVVHRIRPKLEWLESLMTFDPSNEPPPLATSRD